MRRKRTIQPQQDETEYDGILNTICITIDDTAFWSIAGQATDKITGHGIAGGCGGGAGILFAEIPCRDGRQSAEKQWPD
jgi:hypothetical protein